MYIVTLKFTGSKEQASTYMNAHNDWIKAGFNKHGFLLVGGIKPSLGGLIIAHNTTKEALNDFIQKDPFVTENIVTADILEISPARTDAALAFLAQT